MSSEKYMGTVKVGAKGQIVIPKEVREMFNIVPGDSLLILADTERGIAINRTDYFSKIADAIFANQDGNYDKNESKENLEMFAKNIKLAEKNVEVKINDSDKNK